MAFHKSMWKNSIVIFTNFKWIEGDKKHQYFGSARAGDIVYTINCDKLEGKKGEFLKGFITFPGNGKKQGTFTLYSNLKANKDIKDPDFKGILQIGKFMTFDANMWLKTNAKGQQYMAGTIKIKNPEMLEKKKSVGRISHIKDIPEEF